MRTHKLISYLPIPKLQLKLPFTLPHEVEFCLTGELPPASPDRYSLVGKRRSGSRGGVCLVAWRPLPTSRAPYLSHAVHTAFPYYRQYETLLQPCWTLLPFSELVLSQDKKKVFFWSGQSLFVWSNLLLRSLVVLFHRQTNILKY